MYSISRYVAVTLTSFWISFENPREESRQIRRRPEEGARPEKGASSGRSSPICIIYEKENIFTSFCRDDFLMPMHRDALLRTHFNTKSRETRDFQFAKSHVDERVPKWKHELFSSLTSANSYRTLRTKKEKEKSVQVYRINFRGDTFSRRISRRIAAHALKVPDATTRNIREVS